MIRTWDGPRSHERSYGHGPSCCERHRVGDHLVPTRVKLCTRPSPHKRKPQSRRCSGPPQHLAALIRATPERGGTHPQSAHSPPTLPSVSLARGPRAFRRGGQEFVHIEHEAVSITKIRSQVTQVKRLKHVGARRDTVTLLWCCSGYCRFHLVCPDICCLIAY